MADENERMQILEMIESGKITPSQGLALLKALDGSIPPALETGSETAPETAPSAGQEDLPVEEEGSDAEPVEDELPARSLPEAASADTAAAPVSEANSPGPVEESGEFIRRAGFESEAPAANSFARESPSATEGAGQPAAQPEVISPPTIGPDFARWRFFWQIPLWIGVGITVLSGVWMFLAWQSRGIGLLFACAWFPFLLGVAVMAIAWGTRSMPWLHVRIQQKPGQRPERIAISLPLPLSLIRWGLRTFKHKIPNTGNINLDEMIIALKNISPDTPFTVDVDEEDGERVQIYIG